MNEKHQKQWSLGQYILRILDKKEWNQSRLAAEAHLSTGYISWLINGRTSGKEYPPEIGMDTLIKLSKALNVSIDSIAAAYQGEDPEQTTAKGQNDIFKKAFIEAFKALPLEDRRELMPAQRDHLEEELKKLKGNKG